MTLFIFKSKDEDTLCDHKKVPLAVTHPFSKFCIERLIGKSSGKRLRFDSWPHWDSRVVGIRGTARTMVTQTQIRNKYWSCKLYFFRESKPHLLYLSRAATIELDSSYLNNKPLLTVTKDYYTRRTRYCQKISYWDHRIKIYRPQEITSVKLSERMHFHYISAGQTHRACTRDHIEGASHPASRAVRVRVPSGDVTAPRTPLL